MARLTKPETEKDLLLPGRLHPPPRLGILGQVCSRYGVALMSWNVTFQLCNPPPLLAEQAQVICVPTVEHQVWFFWQIWFWLPYWQHPMVENKTVNIPSGWDPPSTLGNISGNSRQLQFIPTDESWIPGGFVVKMQ